MKTFLLLALSLLTLVSIGQPVSGEAAKRRTDHVVLVTIDGLRWQELFSGADERLLNREVGGVRDVEETRTRFWDESPDVRRERLMPFFWSVVAVQGQVLGNAAEESVIRVTNGRYFSYPGYNELLCGFGDDTIDSNAKRPNRNVTVLEWLHRKPAFQGRVAAFGSWDVFPFILNEERSGIPVNAGWQPLEVFANPADAQHWNGLANQLPRVWAGVRYDAFTARGALEYLRVKQPRLLYVALGETDDWAHEGRYDLYLDAAYRSDQAIKDLWNACQELPQYRGRTTLLITTDHGRGDVRDGWKSHGKSIPGSELIWLAAIGPDTKPLGERPKLAATQSQVAATVAALLGEDFAATDPRIAAPVPGIVNNDDP